jgi:catechol 2,3-dioxygenase-like lactoylglutathione lyase family enzyme
MQVTLDHIVLNVKDVKAAADFYRNVFGFKIERLDKFESGVVPFPSLRINEDTVIDLFPPKMWKKDEAPTDHSAKTNLNHFSLALNEREWKELINRLKENNVEIIRYADDNWGAKGIGISVYFHDADGNEIEARYYPSD